MYGQTEDQEKQKKKIIIVSLIMGIIIIILIGVLISAITNKNKNKQIADAETALVQEDKNAEPTKIEENSKDAEKAEDSKRQPPPDWCRLHPRPRSPRWLRHDLRFLQKAQITLAFSA